MSKILLQDMTVKKKRQPAKPAVLSPAPKKDFFRELEDVKETKEVKFKREVENEDNTGVVYSKNKSRYMLWTVALASVTFCLFAVSFLFSRAQVEVFPKTKDVVLNQNFTATSESLPNGLSFNLVLVDGIETKEVKTTEYKEVEEFATGRVIIFNAFSSTSQKLDINTRLEGSNGKIYKTKNAITVPGKNKDDIPGSVEVEIYGAEAGKEYNSAPLDFKIFGFKGTAKYSKFYGRSKGEISGGFTGQAPYIGDSDKTTIVNDLKATLKEKLVKKAVAPGFLLFKEAVFLKVEDSDVTFDTSKKDTVVVKIKGTLSGILLDENKLTKKIAEKNIEKYDGSDVFIPKLNDLTFSLSPSPAEASLENLKNISFNLSGTLQIVWKLDVNKFTNSLLGRSKKDFNQILLDYPNIESSKLTVNPVWKRSLPDKINDIKVIVNYPQ
jgi:hypothetical protein